MTIAQLLATVEHRLAQAGVPTPEVDAGLLLVHVTGWSRSRMLLQRSTPADPATAAALEPLVQRRERREPLQLIVGAVGFRHLDLEVRPGVFIPRPETEVLVGAAIERVPPGGVVVEPCTGSGAIACAIATESDAGEVWATDRSQAAVDLARDNAARSGAAVTVVLGDLLTPVDASLRGRVDVVVSNPPYLAAGDLDDRQPEVVDWDPYDALVSGDTGHEITDRLIAEAPRWLRAGGHLLLEVDSDRAAETSARCHAAGLVGVGVLPDLTGADRIVTAQLAG